LQKKAKRGGKSPFFVTVILRQLKRRKEGRHGILLVDSGRQGEKKGRLLSPEGNKVIEGYKGDGDV